MRTLRPHSEPALNIGRVAYPTGVPADQKAEARELLEMSRARCSLGRLIPQITSRSGCKYLGLLGLISSCLFYFTSKSLQGAELTVPTPYSFSSAKQTGQKLPADQVLEHRIVPGRASGQELSDEELGQLLNTPSPLRGFQKKGGPLNVVKWLPELRWLRTRDFNRWFKGIQNGSVDFLSQPPNHPYGCEVSVNHDYRYFWIRQLKTGTSTIKVGLKAMCNKDSPDPDNHFCSPRLREKPVPDTGNPARGGWTTLCSHLCEIPTRDLRVRTGIYRRRTI